MSCSRCGDQIRPDATRCPACGTAWTDLKRMALTVFLLLGFNAFVSLGSAVYLARLSELLRDMAEDAYATAPVGQAMATYAAALTISVVLMIATGPLFLAWLWRARRIADRRCRRSRSYRSARVVTAWLVPGVNLWLPPRLVRDVWLDTARSVDRAERRWSALVVRAWWLVLGTGLALQTMFALGSADTLDQARLLTNVQLAGTSAVSLAGVLGMLIVFRIDSLQSAEPPPDPSF